MRLEPPIPIRQFHLTFYLMFHVPLTSFDPKISALIIERHRASLCDKHVFWVHMIVSQVPNIQVTIPKTESKES